MERLPIKGSEKVSETIPGVLFSSSPAAGFDETIAAWAPAPVANSTNEIGTNAPKSNQRKLELLLILLSLEEKLDLVLQDCRRDRPEDLGGAAATDLLAGSDRYEPPAMIDKESLR